MRATVNYTEQIYSAQERYLETAEANNLDQDAALLHLRESLKGETSDYGKSSNLQGIFERLSSQFSLTNQGSIEVGHGDIPGPQKGTIFGCLCLFSGKRAVTSIN